MFRAGDGTRRSLLVALVVAASTVAAFASVMIPVSFEELARQAEFVVVGRVGSQQARFNDGKTLILTHTTIEVEQRLVGDAPPSFEIADYGGRVGDQVMFSTGQVTYETGERVLLFVCRDALGLLRACGARQGRMAVVAGADGTPMVKGMAGGEVIEASVRELHARLRAARRVSR